MLVKVVTLTGEERMIDVEPSDRILIIKEKLEEKEGIPPEQQRLIYQGKQLKDDKTVNSYKLKGGTVLHLVVALRGEAVYREWLELRYKILVVDPEVKVMLMDLRKVYNLALITNGTSRAQWEKVDKLNLDPLFDLIIVSGDYPWKKPDPNIFLDACRRLWVAPRQVIMIGDKLETDILGAVQSNLGGSIWIPREDSPPRGPEDPEPSAVVRDMSQLQYAICRVEEKLNAELQCPNSNELLNAAKYFGS